MGRSNDSTTISRKLSTFSLGVSLMRFSSLVILGLGVSALAACSSDDVSTPSLPALGSVRFVNAVADTAGVDLRAVDQIEWSPDVSNLTFRAGTFYQPIEAKARHVRLFPTSTNINIAQTVLLDTTITVEANKRVTWLLTGSARNKASLKIVVMNDDATAPPSGQISVRVVNASSGAVNGYLVTNATDAIADPAAAANVGVLGQSAYVNRAAGNAALRVTDVGSTTVNATAAGPTAAVITGANPAAGVNSAGTKFSVFYFPRSVAGSGAPQTAAFLVPAAVWLVDRNPADQ